MVERVILCRVRLFIKIFSNHSVIATTSVVLTVSPPQVLIKTLGRLPVSKSAAGVRTAATARRRAGRIPPSAAHGCGAQPASPHQLRCDSSAGKARLAAAISPGDGASLGGDVTVSPTRRRERAAGLGRWGFASPSGRRRRASRRARRNAAAGHGAIAGRDAVSPPGVPCHPTYRAATGEATQAEHRNHVPSTGQLKHRRRAPDEAQHCRPASSELKH